MFRIFMIISVLIVSTSAQETTTNGPSSTAEIEERDKFIAELNFNRRLLAKRFRIPHMHELVYDESIYNQLDMKYQDEMPALYISDYKTGMELLNLEANPLWETLETDENITKDEHEKMRMRLNFLNPLQNKIKCLVTENEYPPICCLLGPVRQSFWASFKRDDAGSRCNDGYYSNEGLCSLFPIVPTENTLTAAPQKPICDCEDGDYDLSSSSPSSTRYLLFLLILVFSIFIII